MGSKFCDLMDCSTPIFPVHHQFLEPAQTHVHQVDDAIQTSHPLSFPCPPAFNLSYHHGLFLSHFFTSGGQRIGPLEKVSRVRHLSLFERAPSACVSGANFLSWSLIGLVRKPSYSVSFLHRIFLLSSPHTIILVPRMSIWPSLFSLEKSFLHQSILCAHPPLLRLRRRRSGMRWAMWCTCGTRPIFVAELGG